MWERLDDMPRHKYALLLLPSSRLTDEELEIGPEAATFVGKLADLVPGEHREFWRLALGTLRWNDLERHSRRIVIIWKETIRPDVIDAENEALVAACSPFHTAFLLLTPAVECEPMLMSGTSEGRVPTNIRSIRDARSMSQPGYTSRQWFHQSERPLRPRCTAQRWTDLAAALSTLPDLVWVGLQAFAAGLEEATLEFKIPNFVRAAESVLALPAVGGGRREFARRALLVAPDVCARAFPHDPAHERLEQLYVQRNDCVHGKVPFRVLRERGEPGFDEATRYEFVAEKLAREALMWALGNPRVLAEMGERGRLEAAWLRGGGLP